MRRLKKWLLPALTCLIVAGAAVLPPYLSRLGDQRLFGQIHTEELAADSFPVREPLTFRERLALYAGQYDSAHPVLSFRDNGYFEEPKDKELVEAAMKQLMEAGIVSDWVFRETAFDDVAAARLLLWDPAGEGVQEPSAYWDVEWNYHSDKRRQASVSLVLDAETGLPIHLYIGDTNMSQWLPYDTDALGAWAGRFLALLGLEFREVESAYPMFDPSLNLRYAVAESPVHFLVSRGPTSLTIQPELEDRWADWSNPADG